MPAAPQKRTDLRSDFAERIRAAVARTVGGIFETGSELLEAKAALPHGEFTKMVKADLPFGERQAQKYMSIAGCAALQKANSNSHLPANVSALYELSRLQPDELSPMLRELERHRDEDADTLLPRLLLKKDITRRIGRPKVTVQGVQAKVRELAQRPRPEPKPEPEPTPQPVGELDEFEPVPDGEVSFPSDVKPAIPRERPAIARFSEAPRPADPEPAPPADLVAMKRAWENASPSSRAAFLAWAKDGEA
jgi:hypothetical protein